MLRPPPAPALGDRAARPTRLSRLARGLALAAGLLAPFLTAPAPAWDSVGHRTITWLAMDGLAPDTPVWLREQARMHAIGWQSSEPDRWRGIRSIYLQHENNPDHYFDAEDLVRYGLTLESMPRLRNQYVAAMAVARAQHPEGVDGTLKPRNAKLDPAGEQEWPGFALHAIAEHYAKLTASFRNYRILEKLADPARAPQLEMTRASIAVEMGVLSHFVGDIAQPLHTTRHHHGWVDDRSEPWPDNPFGFTTARSVHALIDGGVIRQNAITYQSLRPGQKYETAIDPADPWQDVLVYFKRSHELVKPLYELEKAGKFKGADAEGRRFVEERLHDAAAMLAALYNGAWKMSEPTQKDIDDFVKYDGFDPGMLPGAPGAASPPVAVP